MSRATRLVATVALAVVVSACSSASSSKPTKRAVAKPTAPSTTEAPGTTEASGTTEARRPPCAPAECTLVQAGDFAGVRLGVAFAPGDPAREAVFLRNFSGISAEGEFQWPTIHPARNTWTWARADRVAEFATSHHLFLTAADFARGYAKLPDWLNAVNDPAELRRVMHEHLHAITARYGDRIKRWIVVNEPFDYDSTAFHPNHFSRVLGPDWIAESFRIARQEAPHAELWLNDAFEEYHADKADALVALTADLRRRGVPVDGVGLQGHLFYGDPDASVVTSLMQRLGALGVKVSITEMDAPVQMTVANRLDVQARRMATMVRACLAAPACDSITWWGLEDARSWLNRAYPFSQLAPLLFDNHLGSKPAFDAVRSALLEGRRR